MILLDYWTTFNMGLAMEKRAEILAKIKKKIQWESKDGREIQTRVVRGEDNDSAFISDTTIAEDGSGRTWCANIPEPCRFIIDADTLKLTAMYKRWLTLLGKSLKSQSLIGKVITLLAIKHNFKAISEWFSYIFNLNKALLEEKHYSQPVKEIRRVLRGRIDENIMDAITLILEYDSAYRYRVQDILPLLDKNKLTGVIPTANELERLFKILMQREYNQDSKLERYGNIKKYIMLALIFMPKFRNLIIDILKDINLKEIEFDECDFYWVCKFGVYNYLGKSWDERKEIINKKYGLVD